jgi:hypothetical protein
MKDDVRMLTVIVLLNTAGIAFILGVITGVVGLIVAAHPHP